MGCLVGVSMSDFWVFGYGSLMWRPGFAHKDSCRARIHGYRRSLCVHSFIHRGTEKRPGLVLGLDRGGSCVGMAFLVRGKDREKVLEYLRERELVTNVYLERQVTLRLEYERTVPAVGYVVDRRHRQYAGSMEPNDAVKRIVGSVGKSGPNEEYVLNTLDHLKSLGIRDHWLEAVGHRLNGHA